MYAYFVVIFCRLESGSDLRQHPIGIIFLPLLLLQAYTTRFDAKAVFENIRFIYSSLKVLILLEAIEFFSVRSWTPFICS